MDTLALRVPHKAPEARDEESPTGFVQIEQGAARGVLLTPDEIDPARSYPLITVLHGAGRQDEMLVKACRGEPERRQALFFVPRSVAPTWDLITGNGRADLDFLHYAYDLIYRRYPVAANAQCLIGYSDGASYALSLGLSNPGFFSALSQLDDHIDIGITEIYGNQSDFHRVFLFLTSDFSAARGFQTIQ